VALPNGQVERSLSAVVWLAERHALSVVLLVAWNVALKEGLDHRLASGHAGPVNGVVSSAVGHIRGAPVLKEQINKFVMPISRQGHQGRKAVLIHAVKIDSLIMINMLRRRRKKKKKKREKKEEEK
jgi:hypothetical protein